MPDATATPVLPVATILLFLLDRSSHTSILSFDKVLLTDTLNSRDLLPSNRFRSSTTALACVLSLACGFKCSRVGNLQCAVTMRENATSKTRLALLLSDILISVVTNSSENFSIRSLKHKFIFHLRAIRKRLHSKTLGANQRRFCHANQNVKPITGESSS